MMTRAYLYPEKTFNNGGLGVAARTLEFKLPTSHPPEDLKMTQSALPYEPSPLILNQMLPVKSQINQTLANLDIDSPDNPRALLNIVTNFTREKFEIARSKRPELFEMDEDELLEVFKNENKLPTPNLNRLRMNFWMDYDRAQLSNRPMRHQAVYAGACSRQYYEMNVLRSPEKVAWVFCPPADYAASLHEALLFGLAEMRRALSLPHARGKKVDTRLIEAKIKIYEKIEARALGAIPQKVLNLHAGVPPDRVDEQMPGASEYEKIQARIKILEARDRMKETGEEDAERQEGK